MSYIHVTSAMSVSCRCSMRILRMGARIVLTHLRRYHQVPSILGRQRRCVDCRRACIGMQECVCVHEKSLSYLTLVRWQLAETMEDTGYQACSKVEVITKILSECNDLDEFAVVSYVQGSGVGAHISLFRTRFCSCVRAAPCC